MIERELCPSARLHIKGAAPKTERTRFSMQPANLKKSNLFIWPQSFDSPLKSLNRKHRYSCSTMISLLVLLFLINVIECQEYVFIVLTMKDRKLMTIKLMTILAIGTLTTQWRLSKIWVSRLVSWVLKDELHLFHNFSRYSQSGLCVSFTSTREHRVCNSMVRTVLLHIPYIALLYLSIMSENDRSSSGRWRKV